MAGKNVTDREPNPADNSPVFPDAPIKASSSPEVVNAAQSMAVAADGASEQSTEATAADAERDDSDLRANCQRLFETIRSCAAPAVRSGRWAFLGIQNDWFRIDMSPSEFVEALAQDYPVESLPELGLLERVDGELRLPSWLDGDAHLRVKFNDDDPTLVFSTDTEFLFPMTHNALDYALERIPPDSTQEPLTIFVVDSLDAVEVMQRLGLLAVSAEGLESLGRDDVDRLFSGDERSDFGWRYYLLLVDFDVAGLDKRPTAAIGEVIKRLADAADVYGVDPARRFGMCRPSEHEFQVLERATSFQDSAHICQLFEKWSAAAKNTRIKSWRTHVDTRPASFSVACAALTSVLQQSNDVARRAEVIVALPAYRRAARDAVMEKFYRDIDRASDPFDQLALMAAAGYAEIFLDSDPLVRAGEAVLAGHTPPSGRELQEELFDQRQRCMNELRRLRRDRKAKR